MTRVLLVGLLAAPTGTSAAPAGRPNFLLLFLDNVGYGDLACYGNRQVKTPNIDRLAAEGVRCTDFYIGSPSCSPSRGALLTGRHPERNGLNHQLSPQENLRGVGLPRSERIIPQYLKPLGYACGAFGKWNIGFGQGSRPTERGFDQFLGHASGNIHYFKHLYHGQNDLRRGTEPLDRRGRYSTDLFADAAVDFIRRHREQPWFAYVAFNAVHFVSTANVEEGEPIEWQVPGEHLALYGCPPDERDATKRFLAVVTALDHAIGRVLSALEDLGLSDKTIVLLISDNGAFMLPGRGLEVQSNAPLRSGGITTWEGGIRVPAILRWPGRFKSGSVCGEMLSSLDVLPMLISAAGGTPPGDRTFDGRDPAAALAGSARSPHDALYWVWRQGRDEHWQAMRWREFKIIRSSPSKPWQLYNLRKDVGETTDLSVSRPQLVERLAARFEHWQEAVMNDPGRSVNSSD